MDTERIYILNFEKKVLSYFFLVFVLFDFLTKAIHLYSSNDCFYRYGAIVKTLFIFTIIFFFLKRYKTITNNIFIKWGGGVILLFVINQLTIEDKLLRRDFNFNIHYFLRCLYPFVFLAFFFPYNNKEVIYKWINIFKYFIVFNSVLIIIGFLLEVPVFRTYYGDEGNRFGYQGLFLYHSESGYIYFMSLSLFYFLYKKFKSKTYMFFCVLVMVSMLLIGTKKALFLLLLFLIYIAYENKKRWTNKKLFFLFGAMFIMVFYIKAPLFKVIKETYKVLFNVYTEKGFITAFFSYRNEAVSERMTPFLNEYWSGINYLIGGPAFRTFRVEMEIFDVFLFFGISGLIVFFLFFRKVIYGLFSKEGIIMTTGLLIAACFSGNFLASINVFLVYLVILKYYYYARENNI